MTIPQTPNCSTYWSHANSWNFEPHGYSLESSLKELQAPLNHDAIEVIDCVGVDGKTALYDAAERADFLAMNTLLSYGASIKSSGILEDPKVAFKFVGYAGPLSFNDSPEDSTKEDVLSPLLEHGILNAMSPDDRDYIREQATQKQYSEDLNRLLVAYTGNMPDKRNITALHIAARDGDLQTVDSILAITPKSEVVLNPDVYFTEQTLEDCSAPSEISLLDQIPLDEFSIPAKSYCNTIVRDTKDVLHTLKHTDAKQVHDTLAARAQKAPSDNRFTVYMNPGHSFVELECSSCANGASYHKSFGRYPNKYKPEAGIILDESSLGKKYSDENLYLKSTFHINDEQAKLIWSKKQSDEINTKYNLFYDNCVDYTMGFAPILGENHFVDFLPAMQFQFNTEAMKSSIGIQYSVFKYKYNINQDLVAAVTSLGMLATYYVAIKTYSKVSSWFFKKNSNTDQTPPNPSLTLQIQTAAVAQNSAVAALRAIIPMNETALNIARLAATTLTINVLKNEMQTAKPLNEHKPQSLLNTRVSLMQGISILEVIAHATTLGLFAIMGQTDPRVGYAAMGTITIGYSFLGINEVRKFWHDITAPPNIDGLDLR